MSTRIILGIDPGYDRVGWAVGHVEKNEVIKLEYGIVLTQKKSSLAARYQAIFCELEKIIVQLQPTEAAVESLFFFANKTNAMHVSEARGVIISCLFQHQVQIFEYTPLQVKQTITGYGRADKQAVEKMVRLQLGQAKLPQQKKLIDDTVDAIAIMLTHAATQSR